MVPMNRSSWAVTSRSRWKGWFWKVANLSDFALTFDHFENPVYPEGPDQLVLEILDADKEARLVDAT